MTARAVAVVVRHTRHNRHTCRLISSPLLATASSRRPTVAGSSKLSPMAARSGSTTGGAAGSGFFAFLTFKSCRGGASRERRRLNECAHHWRRRRGSLRTCDQVREEVHVVLLFCEDGCKRGRALRF